MPFPPFIAPADLAPGDTVPHPDLPTGLRLHVVQSPADPLLELGFGLLTDEFGAAGEMETRDVIERRLGWQPQVPIAGGYRLLYQMMLLFVGDDCVGLRDHTAITHNSGPEVVVHLSHVLVPRKWRRRGLAPILRTLPMLTARELARSVGNPEAPITLFCEMEPADLRLEAHRVRRMSYEKAGFRAIGPQLGYMQPDFRSPESIDSDPQGTRPIPFDFLLRRVGREAETSAPHAQVVHAIDLIYAMYAQSFRPQDMRPCLRWLAGLRASPMTAHPLHPPTQVP